MNAQKIRQWMTSIKNYITSTSGFMKPALATLGGLIGVVLVVEVAAAVVPIVLTALLNLSNSGLFLSVLFTTVISLLVTIYIFVRIIEVMGFGKGSFGGGGRRGY